LSSLGLGTHLGNEDDTTDAQLETAIRACVQGGINLFDTAFTYRGQRAERALGRSLVALIRSQEIARDEIVVCSKGWYRPSSPGPGEPLASAPPSPRKPDPALLKTDLEQSLDNLGLKTLDIYFLHNPDEALAGLPEEEKYSFLRECFEVLETAVDQGKIASYGVATWNAFRVPPNAREHLSIERLKKAARQAAGTSEDHLYFLQCPLNIRMPEPFLSANQLLNQSPMTVTDIARALDLHLLTSAPLLQGRILGNFTREPPPGTTEAQLLLQLVRSCPGTTSCLVGMKQAGHIRQALDLLSTPPLSPEEFWQTIQAMKSA
jgi:aryl-alcohol dehydrogenase-like predicted oxidoreductase